MANEKEFGDLNLVSVNNITLSNTAQLRQALTVLSSVDGIDFKTTGQTFLYTVPAGATIILYDVIIRMTSVSTVTVNPTIKVGLSPSYANWIGSTALPGSLFSNGYISLGGSTTTLSPQSFNAGQDIYIDITTGATATTLTGSVYCLGFFIY